MNTEFLSKILIIGFVILSITSCDMNNSKPQPTENNDTHDEGMPSWQNQKFSMFIHWGIYSIPAGVWKGEKINGYGEQIKGHAKISTEEYRGLASQFDPTKWDADSVAVLAKKAGMKSIIMTSKHHDGFCMFDSKFTKFDVVDATPYKKDVVKELAEACKRHNLKFGVYFSLIDWDYEGATPFVSTRNSDSITPLHHQYNLNQIEELLLNYGEISEIWFDMSSPTYNQSKEMVALVKKSQPNCLVSGRVWNDQGDFMVMGDNYQPEFKMGVPWQTPASMFDETWSYRSWQERTSVEEKVTEKINSLLSIVSAGGNYLLNIGPKADGTVISFEKQVLEGVGEWLEKNGESIYSTTETPLQNQEWGVITVKPKKLYLNITDYPENNKLIIKGLNVDVKKIYPLSDNSISLKSKISNTGCEIDLTNEIIKDKHATTIVLEYENELTSIPLYLIKENSNKEFVLTLDNAEKYHSYSGYDYYSTKATVIKMKWYVSSNSKEASGVKISISSHENNKFNLSINNQEYKISSLSSNNNTYEAIIQSVKLNTGKINEIELSLIDQSNPHRGMDIESLKIMIN
jgi:alpha-L-fucosidase